MKLEHYEMETNPPKGVLEQGNFRIGKAWGYWSMPPLQQAAIGLVPLRGVRGKAAPKRLAQIKK